MELGCFCFVSLMQKRPITAKKVVMRPPKPLWNMIGLDSPSCQMCYAEWCMYLEHTFESYPHF